MRVRMQRHAEARTAMFADPDLTRDLLLFGLAILEVIERPDDFEPSAADRLARVNNNWPYQAMRLAGFTSADTDNQTENYRLKAIISGDVPKYRPVEPTERACFGEKLRPLGDPCGARVSSWSMVPNAFTGEQHLLGACSNKRHQAEYLARERVAWKAWRDNGSPEPPPNSGGVLARHFDGKNMRRLYDWARDFHKTKPIEETESADLAPVISLAGRKK